MQKVKIGFAGDGWGAVSAVRGLQQHFSLQCLTTDKAVINELLENCARITAFDQFNCEMIVCAGYRPIINEEFVTKFNIINIHYSLLPAYRGLHSTAWAIMNGEEKLGLSIFRMNQFIDDGPIIHQKEFKNDHISSATHYMNLMNQFVEEKLGEIILQYYRGLLVPKEQNMKEASWVGKRNHSHNLIDFNKGFEYCTRLFRVLQKPYPMPQIEYKNKRYGIGKVTFHPSKIETDISRILNIDKNGVWVKSKDGYTVLNELMDSSGKKVNNEIFKIGSFANT